jgi:hypothetical protein
MAQVVEIIQQDECGECLNGKAQQLEDFLLSLSALSPHEKKICIKTTLSVILWSRDLRPVRSRSAGIRARVKYVVPGVGAVCKTSFVNCFDVSPSTLSRYRCQIRRGELFSM